MPEIGITGLIVILVVALLVFGPKRLPEIGRAVGKGMREFKDSVSGKDTKNELPPASPPDEQPPPPRGGGDAGRAPRRAARAAGLLPDRGRGGHDLHVRLSRALAALAQSAASRP